MVLLGRFLCVPCSVLALADTHIWRRRPQTHLFLRGSLEHPARHTSPSISCTTEMFHKSAHSLQGDQHFVRALRKIYGAPFFLSHHTQSERFLINCLFTAQLPRRTRRIVVSLFGCSDFEPSQFLCTTSHLSSPHSAHLQNEQSDYGFAWWVPHNRIRCNWVRTTSLPDSIRSISKISNAAR